MTFMRDAVISNLEQSEAEGDWSYAEHNNNFLPPFVDHLPDPAPNSYRAKLKELWFFTHAQEFEGASAELHEEFLLNYQLPIMNRFGLVAYGCCETLDRKIEFLRKISNLRRICIGPTANMESSADQIGMDYILAAESVYGRARVRSGAVSRYRSHRFSAEQGVPYRTDAERDDDH